VSGDAAWESHWLPRARGVEPDSGDEGWYFTGRTGLLRDLAGWLEKGFDREQPERAPVTVLTGAPGTGKSAVLAHLVALTVPGVTPPAYRDAVPGARPGLVTAAVHGRGKDLAAVAGEIARALGGPAADPAELIRYANRRAKPFTVVVDALDEADPDAWRGICRLLVTLAGDPAGVGVRVLVSVRRPAERTELNQVVALLGRSRRTIVLDRPPYLSQHDLSAYVEQRLTRVGQPGPGPDVGGGSPTPYAGQGRLARRVAMAVARRAAGNYLVAQLVSRYLAEAADVVDTREPGWSDQFPETVETALDEYLARIDDSRGRRRLHDLLMPLAFALGEGLASDGTWAALAAALSGSPCGPGDITALLDTAAGFLVDRSPHGSYRLYHASMERYLRLRCLHPAPQEAITGALAASVPTSGPGRWASADPYVLRHLVEHARAAGDDTLGRLLSDDDLVLHAEPAGMLRSLTAPPRALREVARAYQRVAHHFTADIGARAAYLRLSARQADVERFARLQRPAMPWLAGSAMWESQPDHEVLYALDTFPQAAWLSCGPAAPGRTGPVTIVTSRSGGELNLIHVADGVVQDSERWAAHAGTVSAVGGCESDDSRLLVVSGDNAGCLFLAAVDDALLLPLNPHPHPIHDAEVTSVAVAPAAEDSVYCVSGDAEGNVVVSRTGPDGAKRLGACSLGSRITSTAVTVAGGTVHAAAGTLDGHLEAMQYDGRQLARIPGLRMSAFGVQALDFARGTGPARLWAGTSDGLLTGFLSDSGALTATHQAKGVEAAFTALHSRTDMVLTGSAYGHVARLPLADQAGAPGVRARLHDGRVVALAAAGNHPAPAIISLGEDRRVVRWPADLDAAPGQSGQVRVARVALAAATTAQPDGSLSVVTIDDEGRTVIWAARDGQLDIDRVAGGGPRGEPVGTVTADGGSRGSSQVALSPAAATGTRRPVRGSHQAIAAARSPEGLNIVTVSTMGAVRLYQLADGETDPQAVAGTDGQQLVTTIAAAPAGNAGLAVATGSAEGSVEVWAVESGQFVPVSPATSLDAMDLRLGFVSGGHSGEARQLITGDARGNLQLLAVEAGTLRPLAPPWHHRNVSLTAVAARRGQARTTVAAGTLDGEVAFWSVDPAGPPTWLTSVHLGSRVLSIGLGSQADAVIWCRHGAVTLTHVNGLPL
jgi:WD40 repeat protein